MSCEIPLHLQIQINGTKNKFLINTCSLTRNATLAHTKECFTVPYRNQETTNKLFTECITLIFLSFEVSVKSLHVIPSIVWYCVCKAVVMNMSKHVLQMEITETTRMPSS